MVSNQKKEMTIEEKDNKIIFNILVITAVLIIVGFIYSILNKPQPIKNNMKSRIEINQPIKIT